MLKEFIDPEQAGSSKVAYTAATPQVAESLATGQAEPIPTDLAAGVVCRCGHVNAAGTDQCARPGCRKTLKHNSMSRKHGIYSAATPIEFETDAAALFQQSVLDAGGKDELIARVLADHEYRAVVHVTIKKLSWALNHHGFFDRRGRLRTTWIARLESLINTAMALDKTLGLHRKARQVPTLHEVMNGDQ